jgi:hypothetical protein
LQFTYPKASIKDAQATGEAFSPQKRISSTSKDENSVLFFYFFWSFLPSWIRIRNLYADPDPEAQINADPDPKPSIAVLQYCSIAVLLLGLRDSDPDPLV